MIKHHLSKFNPDPEIRKTPQKVKLLESQRKSRLEVINIKAAEMDKSTPDQDYSDARRLRSQYDKVRKFACFRRFAVENDLESPNNGFKYESVLKNRRRKIDLNNIHSEGKPGYKKNKIEELNLTTK